MTEGDLSIRLVKCRQRVIQDLLHERCQEGYWEGHLSSSALSTATAITALATMDRVGHETHSGHLQQAGLRWLASHVNDDGGWGDTTCSLSNISTTTLVWSAFAACDGLDVYPEVMAAAEQWLRRRAGGLGSKHLSQAITQRYGKDKTFSVPILTMCAIAGRFGEGRKAWESITDLPFELAALPPQWFAALRLPVVSYALPALIAIGQVKHHHAPSKNPLIRGLRKACRSITLRRLSSIQPSSGGFLEATPLTSFVVMSLAASGEAANTVAQKGMQFLKESFREDGSWPIDTHLATWVTSLAVHGLGRKGCQQLEAQGRRAIHRWLLDQQYLQKHPYTQAPPGGWAWTPLPGGVPDADDTPGALIALHQLSENPASEIDRAMLGIRWLLGLQNRDGGMPTFCRGWGHLPFDRSSADITAHAIRAWHLWKPYVTPPLQRSIQVATSRALDYLKRMQKEDGSWDPLWFGNQHLEGENNPLYGTAKVVEGWLCLASEPAKESGLSHAIHWLIDQQSDNGGWGATKGLPNTIEETALAVSALALAASRWPGEDHPQGLRLHQSLRKGAGWLCQRVEDQSYRNHAPIGFYFAKLWYFERLYPMVYTAAAFKALEDGCHEEPTQAKLPNP